MRLTRTLGVLVAAFTMAAVLGVGAGSAIAQDTSNVRIVHALDLTGDGVGGTPVSVCVDGDLLDADFTVGEAIGPVPLPAATYDVQILAGGAADCAGAPLFGASLDVPAGQDLTAMAYYDVATPGPGIAVLADDVTCTDAGNGRVTARHAADAGDVDVLADGTVLFADLPNGGQDSADVPTATYGVAVAAPGTTTPVIGPVDVAVADAADTQVYAFGGVAGPLGAFVLTAPLSTCAVPVAPTTAPATPTTVAPAAAVQPAFTG